MRSHAPVVFTVLLLFVMGSTSALYAQGTSAPADTTASKEAVTSNSSNSTTKEAAKEPAFFTVSGGWSWPMGGPVENQYQTGIGMAVSFRTGFAADYLAGLEFGYTWYSLDGSGLAGKNPGSTYAGGDMGILSITTENDYLFGVPGRRMRPFLNLGLGYYKSFIDDATVTTGSTSSAYSTGVYEGSFFGFHGGIGALITGQRFGLRLDANYQHLFAGGPDLEFFYARGGLVFYMN